MGGRTAYPWVLRSKITVKYRFYIDLISMFRPIGRLYISYQKFYYI